MPLIAIINAHFVAYFRVLIFAHTDAVIGWNIFENNQSPFTEQHQLRYIGHNGYKNITEHRFQIEIHTKFIQRTKSCWTMMKAFSNRTIAFLRIIWIFFFLNWFHSMFVAISFLFSWKFSFTFIHSLTFILLFSLNKAILLLSLNGNRFILACKWKNSNNIHFYFLLCQFHLWQMHTNSCVLATTSSYIWLILFSVYFFLLRRLR